MELIKIKTLKELPELQAEKYYKVEKMKCDYCNNEIKKGEEYYLLSYKSSIYDELEFKDICKTCIKTKNFANLIFENIYVSFDKTKFVKSNSYKKYYWVAENEYEEIDNDK